MTKQEQERFEKEFHAFQKELLSKCEPPVDIDRTPDYDPRNLWVRPEVLKDLSDNLKAKFPGHENDVQIEIVYFVMNRGPKQLEPANGGFVVI